MVCVSGGVRSSPGSFHVRLDLGIRYGTQEIKETKGVLRFLV